MTPKQESWVGRLAVGGLVALLAWFARDKIGKIEAQVDDLRAHDLRHEVEINILETKLDYVVDGITEIRQAVKR